MGNRQLLFSLTTAVLLLSGCNGIVRHKTLGFRKSATVEFCRRSPVWLSPAAAVGGVAVDLPVAALDTAANPFCALCLIARGPDPRAEFDARNLLFLPLWVWTLPVGMAALPFLPEESYRELFGNGSALWETPPPEQKPEPSPLPADGREASAAAPVQDLR